MSVYVAVRVNRSEVVTLQARRITRVHPRMGGTPDDEVNTYAVRRFSTVRQQAMGPPVATVEHRYGDGAVVLSRKVLEAAEALYTPSRTR